MRPSINLDELASDLFQMFDVDPQRFGLNGDGDLTVHNGVIYARLVEYSDDGEVSRRFSVRVTVHEDGAS